MTQINLRQASASGWKNYKMGELLAEFVSHDYIQTAPSNGRTGTLYGDALT
jgi:hypothetical protein